MGDPQAAARDKPKGNASQIAVIQAVKRYIAIRVGFYKPDARGCPLRVERVSPPANSIHGAAGGQLRTVAEAIRLPQSCH
jgi:hypothetical protein